MAPGMREALRAVVLAILALVAPAAAKRPLCQDGRFVQAAPILPGFAPRPSDAVVVKDGELSIESELGRGTTVRLTIPAAPEVARAQAGEGAHPPRGLGR